MGVTISSLRCPSLPLKTRTREIRSSWYRGAPGAWHIAQVCDFRSTELCRSSALVENITWPTRLNMRMRSIPCLSAMNRAAAYEMMQTIAVDSLLERNGLHHLVRRCAMIVEHGVPGGAGDGLGKLVRSQSHRP